MPKKVKSITVEEARQINKEYGGAAFNESNVESAIHMGRGKGLYTQIAYMLRAMLVGHAYMDGNKRTGFATAVVMLQKNGIELKPEQKDELSKQVAKMARKNIDNIGTIARMVEYAVKGD